MKKLQKLAKKQAPFSLFFLFALLFLCQLPAQTPPPAQGPDDCVNSPSYIPWNMFKQIIEDAGDQVIQDANTNMENCRDIQVCDPFTGNCQLKNVCQFKMRWIESRKPTTCSDCVFGPDLKSTRYLDLPNQNYVNIHFSLGFEIYGIGPLNFSRNIFTGVDVKISCEGWRDGSGVIKVNTDIEKPFIDGGSSFLEDFFDFFSAGALSNYIDNRVNAQLNDMVLNSPVFEPENGACKCLGYFGNLIYWEPPAPQNLAVLEPTLKISLKKIKRVQPLQPGNTNTEEDVSFEFWFNGRYAAFPDYFEERLRMSRGEEVFIDDLFITVPLPEGDETSQLIVSNSMGDIAGWVEFDQAEHFGAGTHSVFTSRRVASPISLLPQDNDGGSGIQIDKTYEIEFEIDINDPTVVQVGFVKDGGTLWNVAESPFLPVSLQDVIDMKITYDNKPGDQPVNAILLIGEQSLVIDPDHSLENVKKIKLSHKKGTKKKNRERIPLLARQ